MGWEGGNFVNQLPCCPKANPFSSRGLDAGKFPNLVHVPNVSPWVGPDAWGTGEDALAKPNQGSKRWSGQSGCSGSKVGVLLASLQGTPQKST